MRALPRLFLALLLGVTFVATQAPAATYATAIGATGTGVETLALPPRVTDGDSVSCAPGGYCMLAANPPMSSSDGGSTWTPVPLPLGMSLSHVECAAPGVCLGLQNYNTIVRTADGGLTWTTTAITDGLLDALKCTSAVHCIAVGGAFSNASSVWTTDDGATWIKRFEGVTPEQLLAVDCASATFCVATGQSAAAYQTLDGGMTWSVIGIPGPVYFRAASCAAPAMCVITLNSNNPFQASNFVTTDGGAHWATNPGAGLPGLYRTCASATLCFGYSFNVGVFDPAGATSTTPVFPFGPPDVQLADCAGLSCVAIASGGFPFTTSSLRNPFWSSDGGVHWSRSATVPDRPVLRQVSCADATHCVATGDVDQLTPQARLAPTVKVTADAGTTWVDVSPPAINSSVVECYAGGTCLMHGPDSTNPAIDRVASSTDSGGSWQLVAPLNMVVSGSICSVAGECLAIGQVSSPSPTVMAQHSGDHGVTWSPLASFPGSVVKVGCSSVSTCIADVWTGLAYIVMRTIDGGATWQNATPAGFGGLNWPLPDYISCSALGCLIPAYDTAGFPHVYFTPDVGSSWPPAPMPFSALLPGVSPAPPQCIGSTCFAVVRGLAMVAVGAVGWSPIGGVGSLAPMRLACPQPTVCIALSSRGSLLGSSLTRIALTYGPLPTVSGVVPARLLETRSGPDMATTDHRFESIGALPSGSTLELPVAGRGGVSNIATSAVLNVTVTEPAGPGFITVFPCGTARPTASNLNFTKGLTVANSVLSKLGATGSVCIYTTTTTHLIVDADAFVPSASDSLIGLPPARLLETRYAPDLLTVDGFYQWTGRLQDGATMQLPVTGRGGVRPLAVAAELNVTVTEASGAGFLTVYPCDQPRPVASNVNYIAGQTVANAVYAKLDPAGFVCIYAKTSTHVVVDVNAYAPATSFLTGLTPARVLETRSGLPTVDGLFADTGRLATRTPFVLQVGGRGGVPADAAAAVLNVTVTEPTAQGFMTVYPCDQPLPLASNVNFAAGATVANVVVAKLAANGTVCLYSSAPTHSAIDVDAYLP